MATYTIENLDISLSLAQAFDNLSETVTQIQGNQFHVEHKAYIHESVISRVFWLVSDPTDPSQTGASTKVAYDDQVFKLFMPHKVDISDGTEMGGKGLDGQYATPTANQLASGGADISNLGNPIVRDCILTREVLVHALDDPIGTAGSKVDPEGLFTNQVPAVKQRAIAGMSDVINGNDNLMRSDLVQKFKVGLKNAVDSKLANGGPLYSAPFTEITGHENYAQNYAKEQARTLILSDNSFNKTFTGDFSGSIHEDFIKQAASKVAVGDGALPPYEKLRTAADVSNSITHAGQVLFERKDGQRDISTNSSGTNDRYAYPLTFYDGDKIEFLVTLNHASVTVDGNTKVVPPTKIKFQVNVIPDDFRTYGAYPNINTDYNPIVLP